jgi:hypothetical protein
MPANAAFAERRPTHRHCGRLSVVKTSGMLDADSRMKNAMKMHLANQLLPC